MRYFFHNAILLKIKSAYSNCQKVNLSVIKHDRKRTCIYLPSNGAYIMVSIWHYKSPNVRVTQNPSVYRLSNNYFSSKGNEGGSRG